jgi:hypothetical protein
MSKLRLLTSLLFAGLSESYLASKDILFGDGLGKGG